MKFDVDYFIAKFSAIPDKLWHTGFYYDVKNKVKRCALGHCGEHVKGGWTGTGESLSLQRIFEQYGFNVASVNDNLDYRSTKYGKRPRTRILRVLKLIKAKQQKLKRVNAS